MECLCRFKKVRYDDDKFINAFSNFGSRVAKIFEQYLCIIVILITICTKIKISTQTLKCLKLYSNSHLPLCSLHYNTRRIRKSINSIKLCKIRFKLYSVIYYYSKTITIFIIVYYLLFTGLFSLLLDCFSTFYGIYLVIQKWHL